MNFLKIRFLIILAVFSMFSIDCVDRSLGKVEPKTYTGVTESIEQVDMTKVDILVVVDNSESMRQEQDLLVENFRSLIKELIDPSDSNQDGKPDYPAVEDLHLGVVSTDLGTGEYDISDNCSEIGDDGILKNAPSPFIATCADLAPFPQIIAYPDLSNDPEVIADDFQCIAALGTDGCGIEQPLEAGLKALTVQSAQGRPNEGFMRSDSLLAILFVTDENDCSMKDYNLLSPSIPGSLQVRCADPDYKDQYLYSVDYFYEEFSKLRSDEPDKLVISVIAGVPKTWGGTLEELQALEKTTEDNTSMEISCETPGLGKAYSPVRLADLALRFGENGSVFSICFEDWKPAIASITEKIQSKLTGKCLAREIDVDAGCVITELIEGEQNCDELDGNYDYFMDEFTTVTDDDGTIWTKCSILNKNDNPSGEGWYYLSPEENPENNCPEIRFTDNSVPEVGTKTFLECTTALCPQRRICNGAGPDGTDCCYEGQYCSNGQCLDDPRN